VLVNVLRDAVGPAAGCPACPRLGRQPCKRPARAARSIRRSTSRTLDRYSSQPPAVGRADGLAIPGCVGHHRVQDAVVGPADLVAEQAIERQGRVDSSGVGVVGEVQELCEL